MSLSSVGIFLSLILFALVNSAQTVDTEVTARAQSFADGKLIIQVSGTQQFVLAAPPVELQQEMLVLPADQQQSFLATREMFLTQAAKALRALRWGLGIGVLIKNRLQYYLQQKQQQKWRDYAGALGGEAGLDILSALEREEKFTQAQARAHKNKTLAEKSHDIIQTVLTNLDRNLWQQAALVAHANEFGMVAAIGLNAEGGMYGQKGWGGLFDLGISLGYNKEEKALAIQLFNDVEKFRSTQMPAAFVIGMTSKMGVYLANSKDPQQKTGSVYYPPMAPLFSAQTGSGYMFGLSSGGIFSWPPSPLGDLLTYSNDLRQNILIRVSVSPVLKNFLRFESQALSRVYSVSKESVYNIYLRIKRLFQPPLHCSRAF